MTNEEAVSFIKNAVRSNHLQYWADLGCGGGTFTKALSAVLPTGSAITAVDREKQRLEIEDVNFIRANFENDELQLEELDGILIANALHYVSDKACLITGLNGYLPPSLFLSSSNMILTGRTDGYLIPSRLKN